ncbi:uncharacterized protein EV420DRAFT_579041 [Desarmillaria tabescens]|uniref:Uncharacterized protein n=1 Tax=Armillaria tabescens TaxID=1929756 RepID=A0AA39J093_ARMTA|nr:uncharacterized protein EV420DRAFT_579041 [Desarmillaria tabescens]KAK0433124.1 hypothetical protein EV420DRAFT_579041 [Desarmillaria tabescens]
MRVLRGHLPLLHPRPNRRSLVRQRHLKISYADHDCSLPVMRVSNPLVCPRCLQLYVRVVLLLCTVPALQQGSSLSPYQCPPLVMQPSRVPPCVIKTSHIGIPSFPGTLSQKLWNARSCCRRSWTMHYIGLNVRGRMLKSRYCLYLCLDHTFRNSIGQASSLTRPSSHFSPTRVTGRMFLSLPYPR